MFRSLCALLALLLSISSLRATDLNEWTEIPSSYKGRFRPLDVSSRLWLYDIYHRQSLKKSHLRSFGTSSSSALALIWNLHFFGTHRLEEAPLFWVHYADLKKELGLSPTKDYFSFKELKTNAFENKQLNLSAKNTNKHLTEEFTNLVHALNLFEAMEHHSSESSQIYAADLARLQSQKIPKKEIALLLEEHHPLQSRLEMAGPTLQLLPGRYGSGTWFSLKALKVKVYDQNKDSLEWVNNFTLYPDDLFEKIRSRYLDLEKALSEQDNAKIKSVSLSLALLLKEGYRTLEGRPYQEAYGKSLTYPTQGQIKAETLYYAYPWIVLCIGLYSLALFFFLLHFAMQKQIFQYGALITLSTAFCLHTLILAIRCYILERPPVSNMFETIIYVPWVAVFISFILRYFVKNLIVLAASAFVALALLIILQLTNVNSSMENVQAVLDSQYWLIVHVLMIVASYGVFLLCGLLGHLYLGAFTYYRQETPALLFIAKLMLHTMYLGTALLIPGTILGGVWAAESWGRFWDWDPKESWAFISACVYVIWIHAYTFHRLGNFGLAVGSIIGLQAITFTWYGVNYLLGTGLHSYGFGSGGEYFYYLFLAVEAIFLLFVSTRQRQAIQQ